MLSANVFNESNLDVLFRIMTLVGGHHVFQARFLRLRTDDDRKQYIDARIKEAAVREKDKVGTYTSEWHTTHCPHQPFPYPPEPLPCPPEPFPCPPEPFPCVSTHGNSSEGQGKGSGGQCGGVPRWEWFRWTAGWVVISDGNGSGVLQVGVTSDGNGSGGTFPPSQEVLDGSGGEQVVVPVEGTLLLSQEVLDGSGGQLVQQVVVFADGLCLQTNQISMVRVDSRFMSLLI
ncbi:hypothetical protein A4A49_28934 [Nicotiana attenuata]|uniref:Uncharacterized protein n=1 Tax=Nicotiana attenuata TaxID=49451 RepID=A0A1J6JZ49_NICAT|nr:hypothetical protein A4A49_28934 [Nicotiana attenuata]